MQAFMSHVQAFRKHTINSLRTAHDCSARTHYDDFVCERELRAIDFSLTHNVALVHCIEHMHAVLRHYFDDECKARSIDARMKTRATLERAYNALREHAEEARVDALNDAHEAAQCSAMSLVA